MVLVVLCGRALTQARPGMGSWQLVASLPGKLPNGGPPRVTCGDPCTTDDDDGGSLRKMYSDGGPVTEDAQRSAHNDRRRGGSVREDVPRPTTDGGDGTPGAGRL